MTRLASLLFASVSILGCAAGEDHELPDTLVDGAADTLSSPTSFGTFFQGTWQYGTLSSAQKIRNPAWSFELTAGASVKVTTRSAPLASEDLTLERAVVYLYKQQSSGVWKRVAKSDGSGFGKLSSALAQGQYRVIVKGVEDSDEGDFMLKLACTGAGCASGPQCLFGEQFGDVQDQKHGAIEAGNDSRLTSGAMLNAANQAQIIAAVNESSFHVSTIAEAFAAVDDHEIIRTMLTDVPGSRYFKAFEYGAGDNSYGAIFQGDNVHPVAAIHDGFLESCTILAQACVFGRALGEAEHMPDMNVTKTYAFKRASDVPAAFKPQIIEAVTYDGHVPTLAEVFSTVDENTVYVTTFRHTDAREFVLVQYYSGDTAVGSFFAKGQTQRLAEISDGSVESCAAF